jgi:transposase
MAIVGGFDVHRAQITFDYVDTASGEVHGGRIEPACRQTLAAFLNDLPSRQAEFVLEGCTGWLYVADELARAGMGVHVADPAEAAALRGRKKRAKTDRTDARHLRQLLIDQRVPESWIPPAHVLETRRLAWLYLRLLQDRNSWGQRVHAILFHHGAPALAANVSVSTTQATALGYARRLPDADHHAVEVALRMINICNDELAVVHRQLVWVGAHQPGCQAIRAIYGVGELVAPIIWAELGDVRRFSSARQAVRHSGLDITIYESAGKRASGHLARQGPGVLRWALYEAGKSASHRAAPDHSYYTELSGRHGHKIATLSVARKITRRCHHILTALGDTALDPPTSRRSRPGYPQAA